MDIRDLSYPLPRSDKMIPRGCYFSLPPRNVLVLKNVKEHDDRLINWHPELKYLDEHRHQREVTLSKSAAT